MKVRVMVPIIIDADTNDGKVTGFRRAIEPMGAITMTMVQAAVDDQRAWEDNEEKWERFTERAQACQDDGPEEGPEVEE